MLVMSEGYKAGIKAVSECRFSMCKQEPQGGAQENDLRDQEGSQLTKLEVKPRILAWPAGLPIEFLIRTIICLPTIDNRYIQNPPFKRLL